MLLNKLCAQSRPKRGHNLGMYFQEWQNFVWIIKGDGFSFELNSIRILKNFLRELKYIFVINLFLAHAWGVWINNSTLRSLDEWHSFYRPKWANIFVYSNALQLRANFVKIVLILNECSFHIFMSFSGFIGDGEFTSSDANDMTEIQLSRMDMCNMSMILKKRMFSIIQDDVN